jgi:hypothetical protein
LWFRVRASSWATVRTRRALSENFSNLLAILSSQSYAALDVLPIFHIIIK